jgi:hypothetical protein
MLKMNIYPSLVFEMLALAFMNLVIGLRACDCVWVMLLYTAFAMLSSMEKSLFSEQLLIP